MFHNARYWMLTASLFVFHSLMAQQDTGPDPEQRPAQQRDRHEEPFLGGGEGEVLGDEDAQRAHQEPGHEADFEMEPRR